MRRAIALLGLVIAVLGATGVAVAGDAKGPPCSDISTEDQFISRTLGPPNTVTMTLFTPKASCSSITYTLVVRDDLNSTSPPLATDIEVGDDIAHLPEGRDFVELQATESDTDADGVCVFATSSSSRGREIDRVPEASATPNCVTVVQGSPGGGGSYN
jgi:hypothetical protein